MIIFKFLFANWFEILSAIGITGGLIFNGLAQRSDDKSRRVSNLIAITSNHREIWKEYSRRSDLARVTQAQVDLESAPVTPPEAEFINWLVQQANTVFVARKEKQLPEMEGVERDISIFFRLPLAQAVWSERRQFHNRDFVKFMTDCIEVEHESPND
jgi:hypothetical protein